MKHIHSEETIRLIKKAHSLLLNAVRLLELGTLGDAADNAHAALAPLLRADGMISQVQNDVLDNGGFEERDQLHALISKECGLKHPIN